MEGKTASILVVDDNEMNRDLVARRVERMGHRVEYAENGQVAIQALSRAPFDLVLLDVMMPEMSGYEVLEQMKNHEEWRRIPVLMISAATEVESVVRCIELGAEDYLPKPFRPALLTARVNACLEKKRLRDQEAEFLREIAKEKQRSEDLLKVILPGPIIDELKETGSVKPRNYPNVAVLFADIVEFTQYCASEDPDQVLHYLQELIHAFEEISCRHGIQKIKTIGDAYMAAGGLLTDLNNPCKAVIDCGLDMIAAAQQLGAGWKVRIGIHYGSVMGGVVGHRQYLFDLWGDTVNVASRLEQLAAPNSIAVSQAVWDCVAGNYQGTERESVVRGKGAMVIHDITGRRSASADRPARTGALA